MVCWWFPVLTETEWTHTRLFDNASRESSPVVCTCGKLFSPYSQAQVAVTEQRILVNRILVSNRRVYDAHITTVQYSIL